MKTPTKRMPATSILVALVLIASFLSALLPQTVAPQLIFAATSTQEFKTVGTFNFTPTATGTVTVLVVAGGGGGGRCTILGYPAGGGGAGGVIYNTSYPVTAGVNVSVTVGNYGYGGNSSVTHGQNGYNSSFGTLQAAGGGGGGNGPTSGINGYDGGSGGGGGANTLNNVGSGGNGLTGQGYRGGWGKYTTGSVGGGGGGGNGSVGVNGSGANGGSGGTGTGNYSPLFNNAITVNNGYFAGGGGGGGAGGTGGTATQGGGRGGGSGGACNAGTANTGGGGGGGGGGGAANGCNGGTGYVIVMWTTYTLTYTAGSHGSISGTSPQTVGSGQSGTAVEAVPDSCYHFVNWSDSSTSNPRTDTNVQADISVTANFGIDVKTVTYSAGAGGSVNGSWPQNVNCGSDGPWVLASADACYHFVNWNDSSTTNPRHETNVTSNLSYTANFAIITYTLSVSPNNSGGSPYFDGSSPFNCGASATIHANTNSGYTFAGWTPTDSIANASAEDTTVTMSQNRNLTANYIAIPTNTAPTIGYEVVVYNTVGSSNFTPPTGVTSVQVLVVGGGGGGGGAYTGASYFSGGGGGAGGVVYNASYPVTPGVPVDITIGAGGAGGLGYSNGSTYPGNNGSNSVFGFITSYGGGGGGGGHATDTSICTGRDGGSGGGAGVYYFGGGSGSHPGGSANPSGQGNNGGSSYAECCWAFVCFCADNSAGGGGGGAGQAGSNAASTVGGNGGNGLNYSSIFGTSVGATGWFGGGGGGGAFSTRTNGSGGLGGGGGGGLGTNGFNGTANTGGGGGGGGCGTETNGGAGGSGIVIVRYTVTPIALWTTGDSPVETTTISPQVEYNIKIPVTDNDTLNDLVTVKTTLYYDSDGSYSEGEVPISGNTQTCAILTWTKSTNALTIASGDGSSWAVNNSSSVFPSLLGTSGTFEFHFKPGKVATYTTGNANWHIYVIATDNVSNTGSAAKTDLTTNFYSEVIVNTETVNWGDVDPGLTFAEGDPSQETVSVTYICNGNYNESLQASTTWTGSPSGSATLNTGGTPGANEFSLKADDDGTLTGAIIVIGSYQTFDTGTITSESGNTEASNSLWLSIGTPFTKATYSGTIYYQIAQ